MVKHYLPAAPDQPVGIGCQHGAPAQAVVLIHRNVLEEQMDRKAVAFKAPGMAERETQCRRLGENLTPAPAHGIMPFNAPAERMDADRFIRVPDPHHRLKIGALEGVVKSRLGNVR